MGGFLKMYIFHFFRREKNVIFQKTNSRDNLKINIRFLKIFFFLTLVIAN